MLKQIFSFLKTYVVLDDKALENRQAVIDSRSTSFFHQRLVGLNGSIDRIKMEFQQFFLSLSPSWARWKTRWKLAYPALITAIAFEILVVLGCHGVLLFLLPFFFPWLVIYSQTMYGNTRPLSTTSPRRLGRLNQAKTSPFKNKKFFPRES